MTNLRVRWIPELTHEEAGEFMAAFEKDKSVMPADFCKDERRKACCPYPVPNT